MPRKKVLRQVRTVVLSDPDPEGKRRIRERLTARLRPMMSRQEVRARSEELFLLRARRKLSKAAYEKQSKALDVEARLHSHPDVFWGELEDAFLTYWKRARLRPFHRAVIARLRYVETALALLTPQTRLKSSQENLAKAIDRTGVLPWEDEEFPLVLPGKDGELPSPMPRGRLARIIAERATKNHDTYRGYLLQEQERLTTWQKTLEDQGGAYLAANLRRGRRTNLAMCEFIQSVREILKRYVVPRKGSQDAVAWQDVADVCRYFHPARLQPPRKEPRYVADLQGGMDTTFSRFDKDPYESLDTAFWFPTKEALRPLTRRS